MSVELFVYGTLRSGEHNHWVLEEVGAERLGVCRTPPEFTLLNLGPYPGLIRGGNTAVVGEIYRVKHSKLDRLDDFEGHPTLFRRERMIREVFFYIYQGVGVIPSGDWKDRIDTSMRRLA